MTPIDHSHDCWRVHHVCALAEIERLLKALNKANAANSRLLQADHERRRADASQVQTPSGR
jgi:hypothetical protein